MFRKLMATGTIITYRLFSVTDYVYNVFVIVEHTLFKTTSHNTISKIMAYSTNLFNYHSEKLFSATVIVSLLYQLFQVNMYSIVSIVVVV
jgi:hypothetical protein